MKLIDVLNLMAKGELEEGTKIKIYDDEWIFEYDKKKKRAYDLKCEAGCSFFEEYHLSSIEREVEIIGHDTNVAAKIKEIQFGDCDYIEDKTRILTDKLNEVIRELNRRSK